MSTKQMTDLLIEDTQAKFIQEVLSDYKICCLSRQASLAARKEVLTGKAKFGIIGDGKEVPQVAMARAFKRGDFRAGYYRDQTFMFALGLSSLEDFFAQLYADPDNDPFSKGRQMNSHYATPFIDEQGNWTNHLEHYNISSDISSTGGQMARALGLAFASKVYRNNKALQVENTFSNKGNEVCFCTIGDASTSEGVFWETVNAAGVLQVPLAISVWDDGYGISVPKKYQTTKESISEILAGFQSDEEGEGLDIYVAKGWDYAALCELYETGISKVRTSHKPAIFHIEELTQPQGHSTSGSHERYKSKERLEWERKHDCNLMFRQWILETELASEETLLEIESAVIEEVKEAKNRAWATFRNPIRKKSKELLTIMETIAANNPSNQEAATIIKDFKKNREPLRHDLTAAVRNFLFAIAGKQSSEIDELKAWKDANASKAKDDYESDLWSDTPQSALAIPQVAATYDDEAKLETGYNILNTFFDIKLETTPSLIAFGEDVGKIGGVNQGFAGLQDKHGKERVFDTGIREWTIMGQAIGAAMRGLRPIAEIQYLDYLIYGIEPLSDDLATLRYRSGGQQAAPAIIRTRGHRLEGIWHAGSPMGMLINSLRGIYIGVPRNMVQAVGMYNTLLLSDDPGLVIECLNGYRIREKMPNNIGAYTVPFGVPEVLREGKDITIVSYGSCIRIIEAAIPALEKMGINVELVDIQTLLPFDLEHRIVESLKKTNRLLIVDEDVPGGASAYLLQEILEVQGAYRFLDSKPKTLTAAANRPPFGSDGDYFVKPSREDVIEATYEIMRESNPSKFPQL